MGSAAGAGGQGSDAGPPHLARGDLVYRGPAVPCLVAAEGVALVDEDGYRYLDAEASSGTANLGFDATIPAAAARRIASVPALPSFLESRLRKDVAGRLAARLERATGRPGRVAFELGGAQGVELALKVVRRNTSRVHLAVLEGGFHGRSGLASQLSSGHGLRQVTGEWRIPVLRLPYPDTERARFGEPPDRSVQTALSYVEQLTTMEFAGVAAPGQEPDVAALVVEPILNAGGIVRPDPRYLRGLVEIFRSLGALVVVDEVFTGFHRTGPAWGFQHYPGLQPDIVVFGKALTNGVTPLTCVWAREPLMAPERFPPGTHSATYQTTPFALAVAGEVLDRYDAWPDPGARLQRVERGLGAVVDRVTAECPAARSGWACGGLGRVRLAEPVAEEVRDRALRVARDRPVGGFHGLVLSTPGMAPDVIGLAPPLVISDDELAALGELLVRALGTG